MEQMTSYERMMAAIHFQACDRIPVSPLFHYASAHVNGRKVCEYATDPEVLAACSLDACTRFEFDSVMLGTDVAIEAEALGCKVEQPEEAPMHTLSKIIKEDTDIASMKLPDPEKDENFTEIFIDLPVSPGVYQFPYIRNHHIQPRHTRVSV